jgi:hypothetical protein
MGCGSCAPEIASLLKRLAAEYNLDIDLAKLNYKYLTLWNRKDTTAGQRIKSTLSTLKNLKPGNYFFIEHPGLDTPEMRAIWHKGYENVAADRDAVTKVYTSREVMDVISSKGILLESYQSANTATSK